MKISSATPQNRATNAVLCIGGWDPSGGAGLIADTQALSRINAQVSALITTHTAQSQTRWFGAFPADPAIFRMQADGLVADLSERPFLAVKIGALGSSEIATEIDMLLCRLKDSTPALAVVLDPVLKSSSGGDLGRMEWLLPLLPHVNLICPNLQEWEQLQKYTLPNELAVLVTDDGPGAILQQPQQSPREFSYTRRPGNWRGTGCRLASLIAGSLASGKPVEFACADALRHIQDWIHRSASLADENPDLLQAGRTPQLWY